MNDTPSTTSPSTTDLLAWRGLAPGADELDRIELLRAQAEEQAALLHGMAGIRYEEPGLVWRARPTALVDGGPR